MRSRGITFPIPPTIRYVAGLRHKPTGLILPAMVCAVEQSGGKITGIHRTFLRADGRGKASVSSPRMMLGKCSGGAVRLGPVQKRIAICEGIETGMAVAQSCPDRSVWAALSASGMEVVGLPEEVEDVVLCADRDENHRGEEAAKKAAERFTEEGRTVRVVLPPEPYGDFNDTIMRKAVNG
jgi:phage/plasmid primase-like uncharacterized protein